MTFSSFSIPVQPDWKGFLKCLRREATPNRVHNIELIIDNEVQDLICRRYDLLAELDPDNPFFLYQRQVVLQSFLGYDYVVVPTGVNESLIEDLKYTALIADDTAPLQRKGGRVFVDEKRGPITNWVEFEAFPWPDLTKTNTRALDWFQENLPEAMCIIGGEVGSICENLLSLMGYETLCIALYEQRPLVAAIAEKLVAIHCAKVECLLRFDRVKMIWGSDDMGFKTGLLISPRDLREFVLPGHKRMAKMAHNAGRLYLLHSCGKLDRVMDDLIEDVGIDAHHSFEDTIQDVRAAKRAIGSRIALLGGIDIDFLCRANEMEIRQRVRETLAACQPGGGFCLGTGNTVANYIPIDHYLIMLDEGRRYKIER